MAECGVCGRGDKFLFICEHCLEQHCEDHHDPTAHFCEALSGSPTDSEHTSRATTTSSRASSPDTEMGKGISSVSRIKSVVVRLPLTSTGLLVGAILLGAIAGLAVTELTPIINQDDGLLEDGNPLWGNDGADSIADSINESTVERLVVEELNSVRQSASITSVSPDPRLSEIADYHSQDMANRNYTSHVAPDGETVNDRFNRFEYSCSSPAELVLFTQVGMDIEIANNTIQFRNNRQLASGIINLWRQSETHRAALLSTDWEQVGVGVTITSDGRVFVTLNAC